MSITSKILILASALVMAMPVAANAGSPDEITVISYNIRNGEANDGTNSWQYRYPTSAMMIMDQKPDIFGIQEAYDYQVAYLKEYCEGYKCVGVGREDGKHDGEHMSIFYNSKTVKLLKWGTYWLSETPDKPSLGWDAACRRTAHERQEERPQVLLCEHASRPRGNAGAEKRTSPHRGPYQGHEQGRISDDSHGRLQRGTVKSCIVRPRQDDDKCQRRGSQDRQRRNLPRMGQGKRSH